MIQVPDIEQFNRLAERFTALEEDYLFLKRLIMDRVWLSQKETMAILHVSEPTLIRLRRDNILVHRSEGKRFYYGVDSIRIYLLGKKIAPAAVNQQVLTALKGSYNVAHS